MLAFEMASLARQRTRLAGEGMQLVGERWLRAERSKPLAREEVCLERESSLLVREVLRADGDGAWLAREWFRVVVEWRLLGVQGDKQNAGWPGARRPGVLLSPE